MSNSYINYYLDQAGSGLSTFEGVRYQRGNGFFGRLLSGAILPALRFLGRKALNTGVNVGMDVLDGHNFKESIKKHSKKTVRDTANSALLRAQRFVQTGRATKHMLPHVLMATGIPPTKQRRLRRKAIKKKQKRKKKKTAKKPVKKKAVKKKTTRKQTKKQRSKFDFLL